MNKEYYKKIDYIRILSCILVLLYHLNIIKGGFLAVCTFFTLSGYLSCLSALKNNNFSIKEYYVGRLKKIYLPLIIVVFLTIFFARLNSNIGWINLKQETNSVLFGYNNFWQLNANLDYFTKSINSPFIHLWYISILMQFELLFPIIFIAYRKLDNALRKNISTLLIVIMAIGSTILFYIMSKNEDIMHVYYNTLARSFSFIWGILLAILHYKYNFRIAKPLHHFKHVIFTIYSLILIGLCINVSSESQDYAIIMIIVTLISIRLIEYATMDKLYNKNNKVFNILSSCTYEIYLAQYPIIYFAQTCLSNNSFKVPIIICITLIMSYILNIFVNKKIRSKLIIIIKTIIIICISILGIFTLINEKDHTEEMNELENKLSENLKIIEEKNSNYIATVSQEQEEWQKTLKSFENQEEYTAQLVKNLPIVGIGDSVLLGTSDELYKKFPNGYFNGKVSRTISQAKELVLELKEQGKLGNTLLFALANNGDYSNRINKDFIELLDGREIFWVNAVGADDPEFNDRFREFAKDYPNIHIVEWDKAAQGHSEYFYADGIHVKGDGIKAYVDTIYNAIYNKYLTDFETNKENVTKQHENELKEKIVFYGNDLLTNCYSYLSNKFEKAVFYTKTDYKSLYDELEYKINNNSLENNIVLLFDKDVNIKTEDYERISELCKTHNIIIFNVTSEKISVTNDNTKIIDFYNELLDNNNYTIADKIHLSDEGNKALTLLIEKSLK